MLRTAFHQDASFFALRGEQVAVCWVLCDEVTEASGAIGYVRGSHRWPDRDGKPGVVLQGKSFVTNLPKRKENPGERSQPAYHVPDIEDHEEDYDIVYFEAQPGDVVIHHCNTLHGSRGNTSSVRHRRPPQCVILVTTWLLWFAATWCPRLQVKERWLKRI